MKRAIPLFILPLAMLMLPGCGDKLPDSSTPDQQAKQKEAEKTMQKALETDPTLNKRSGPPPGAGYMAPPGR